MPRPRSTSRLVAAIGALAASILPCHADSAVARRQGDAHSPLALYYRDMEKSFTRMVRLMLSQPLVTSQPMLPTSSLLPVMPVTRFLLPAVVTVSAALSMVLL